MTPLACHECPTPDVTDRDGWDCQDCAAWREAAGQRLISEMRHAHYLPEATASVYLAAMTHAHERHGRDAMTLHACPRCRMCSVEDCPRVGGCEDQPGDGPCEHGEVRCDTHPCEECADDVGKRLLWEIFGRRP